MLKSYCHWTGWNFFFLYGNCYLQVLFEQTTNKRKEEEGKVRSERTPMVVEFDDRDFWNFELQLYKGNTYVERVCKMWPSNEECYFYHDTAFLYAILDFFFFFLMASVWFLMLKHELPIPRNSPPQDGEILIYNRRNFAVISTEKTQL